MKTKRVNRYTENHYGFPVALLNVELIKVRGVWVPQVDYNLLTSDVLRCLAEGSGRITGNQLRMIRLNLKMNLQKFAERFGVTHPAVIKWEKAANNRVGMNWTMEKDLRLFILTSLGRPAHEIVSLYKRLSNAHSSDPLLVEVVCAEDEIQNEQQHRTVDWYAKMEEFTPLIAEVQPVYGGFSRSIVVATKTGTYGSTKHIFTGNI